MFESAYKPSLLAVASECTRVNPLTSIKHQFNDTNFSSDRWKSCMFWGLEKSGSNFHLVLCLYLVSEGILEGKIFLKHIYFKEQTHKWIVVSQSASGNHCVTMVAFLPIPSDPLYHQYKIALVLKIIFLRRFWRSLSTQNLPLTFFIQMEPFIQVHLKQNIKFSPYIVPVPNSSTWNELSFFIQKQFSAQKHQQYL